MAISLFCHTTYAVFDAQRITDVLALDNPEIFSHKFLISHPKPSSDINKEIALEFGLDTQSMFMVHLNDKSAAGSIRDVAKLLKDTFGLRNIVVLFENETLI